MAPSSNVTEDDPVIAEYDVFITPDPAHQIYLLQYPNRARDQPYNERNRMKPLEMRVKPKAGFIELDVPVHVHANFDKRKGILWGEAIRKAKERGPANFGLSSGFGIEHGRARPPNRNAERAGHNMGDDQSDEETFDGLLSAFDDANDKGHVLNKQTLGGQIIKEEVGKPFYMLGAFRGKELHLTRVTGLVQMRPQFHYLDALSQQERIKGRREREAGETPRISEPRAVQMMMKAAESDNVDTAITNKFLLKAEEEPWMKLRFHDEDTDEAYNSYHEHLFVEDTSNAPKLVSALPNEQYLEAIGAPRRDSSGRIRKKPLTRRQLQTVEESLDSDHPMSDQPTREDRNDAAGTL